MLKHEEDARKVFKNAREFRPVNRFGRTIGWTFAVPIDEETTSGQHGYSWVDLHGNVPSDVYGAEYEAAGFLKSYQKVKRQAPANPLEKRA